jgi:hypothetical protein
MYGKYKINLLKEKTRKETLNWEQCIICQCSNAESVICMRDVGKDSFVRSMEIRRDEVYSRILQEMSTIVCDIVETCSVLVKIYLICFENTAVLFTCIFSRAITVVNNFNFT